MDNCNICSFSLSAIFRVTSDLFQLYLPLKSLLDILRELQIKQIRFSFTTVSRCKLCSTCMYNCLDIYIMHYGYQGICTGSLFFMLYLEYKVGPGRFLIGHKVRIRKTQLLILCHTVRAVACILLLLLLVQVRRLQCYFSQITKHILHFGWFGL